LERKRISAHWSLWLIVAASFIVSLSLYSKLPDQIPMHWNLAGEVDRYGSRLEGAFTMPVLSAVILLMLIWLPAIDPRKKSYEKFADFYKLFQWVMVLFLIGMQSLTLSWALGYQFSISLYVKLGIGILFMFLGNYLGKTRSNWFVGIRTPWTLENDEVWNKTHRLAGRLMFAAGILTLILAFIDQGFTMFLLLGAVLLASVIPVIYSFLLYRQLAR